MQEALAQMGSQEALDCGSAGTVLRFMAFRVSRIPGRHVLKGTPRLLSRPQAELKEILAQLGVEVSLHADHLTIEGTGWKPPGRLVVNRKNSSQFVSGLLLSAWDLEFPLALEWNEHEVSEGYWQMTIQLVKEFGMDVRPAANGVLVAPRSSVKINQYEIESDLSSSFAIAAYAVLNGEATLRRFPLASLQPDRAFVSILEELGAIIERGPGYIRVRQSNPQAPALSGGHWNLSDCPDLFPVLATLCAFAKGPSRLDGAPHLVFKESNRIAKTAELLDRLGVPTRVLPDGMEIHPPERLRAPAHAFSFDTDHDHRLAFAASLVASRDYPIEILHPEVVAKSFPEYWELLVKNSRDL